MGKNVWKIWCLVLTALMLVWTMPMLAVADTVPAGYTPIYTKSDLNNIRNNLNGNYILMNDIVFSEADFEAGGDFYNDGMGWLPIGGEFSAWSSTYNEFTGIFDGNGYSIKNLKMHRTPTSESASPEKTVYLPGGNSIMLDARHYFGLFTVNAGIIKNLNLDVDFNIKANPHAVAGGVCGLNSGLISDCKVSGKLFIDKTTDTADSYIGGIAGYIGGGTITLCSNEADIDGSNPHYYYLINCGGITGGSLGIDENVISYCYNTGSISAQSESIGYIGGIVARTSNDSSFYDGCSFRIENCYNSGAIGNESVSAKIAGICAEGDYADISIINCYNVGSILVSGKTAAIVFGQNRASNCYYLTDSADCFWCSYWSSTKYIFNNLQDAQMKTEEDFVGFDFDDVWIIDSKADYPYPQLRENLQSKNIHQKHNYTSEITTPATHLAEGVETFTCECGDTYTSPVEKLAEHSYTSVVTAPTCTNGGYTTYTCECTDSYVADYVPSVGHSYTSEITTPATHLTEGVETFTCECGDTYTSPVEKLAGHTYISVVTAPTCTNDGYTTYTCVCTDSYVADYVPSVGHSYTSEITTPATHLAEGVETFTCECEATYTSPVEKLAEHSYTSVVTAPTCTNDGYTTYICACTDSYVASYVEKIAHTYVTTTIAATFTENGSITVGCRVCGDIKNSTKINQVETVSLSATSYTYNGSVRTPTVTVKDTAGNVLKKDTDYTVTYAKGRINVGTYNVTVNMIGNYTGTETLSFTIKPKDISACTVKLSSTSYTYNGSLKTPTVIVTNSYGAKLTEGKSYTVTYASGRKAPGEYTVTVKMAGNYTGTKTLSFKINPIDISSCTVKLSSTSYTYSGGVKKPSVTVTNSYGTVLTEGKSYIVTYASGRKNIGTYKVTVTMKGNYTGTKTLSFKIKPVDISTCTVKLSNTSYTFDGKVKAPTVTVTNASGTKLTKDTSYTVTYASGRKNAGTYNVTVKMTGNYTGTKTLSFKIKPVDISTCKIKLSNTSYTYDGKLKTPTVTVTNANGTKLTKGTSYTVTYALGRKNAGTYNVTVKMTGNYTGTKILSFKIKPVDISKCTVSLSATSYTYDGNVKAPTVTVKNAGGTKLTKGTSYTVTYASGRKNVGTYKVTVTMKGNYTGTKTLTFKINPPATTVASLTAGTKSITVNLTKKTTQTTGYQIQYSTSKDFTNAKTKTITSNSTVKTTLSSLTSGKTYYVRVRTYKTVNDVKYYSGWSAYKYVKTK